MQKGEGQPWFLHEVGLGTFSVSFPAVESLDKWKLLGLERGENPKPTHLPPSITPSLASYMGHLETLQTVALENPGLDSRLHPFYNLCGFGQ